MIVSSIKQSISNCGTLELCQNGRVQETHKRGRLRTNDQQTKLMFIQGSLQLAMVTKPSTRWKPSVIDWSKLEMKL